MQVRRALSLMLVAALAAAPACSRPAAMATAPAASVAAASPATAATPPALQRYSLKIVKVFPHDPNAFTEGLFYDHGSLYESTGREGKSSIRQVDLDTGQVIRQTTIDSHYFGEGIAPWNGRIIGLTWQTETGFVWNQADLKLKSNFAYKGEGWGMTGNSKNLIMSDGTPTLKFLDPITLKVVKSISVSYQGQPIDQVNELEWVDGQILANIWRTKNIVRIDPTTGLINGVVDLSSLPEVTSPPPDGDAVANGIAFDPNGHRLFVTGKLWPHLYQVELVPQP